MNSVELQKKFPEVYKDFFSKNDLVASGCLSFPWGPRSVANAPHRLILKSCLPIRCYVGIKERNDDQIVFEDMIINTGTTNGFETISPEIILKEINKIIEPIRVFLSERGITKGYSIHVLSEIGKGHSLGFTGTFSAILASIFLLITKEISEQALSDSENFVFSREQEKIFRLAWQWELPLRKGRTYGQTIMHTLSGLSTPSLFTVGANSELITLDQAINSPIYFSDFHDIAPECNRSFEIPFEYALIFSGTISETFKLEGFREADIRNSNNLTNFIQERIFPNIPTDKLYYRALLEQTPPYIYFSDAIGILNTETIKKFQELFLSGYNKILLEDFFEHMNHLRGLLSIIEPQNNFANEFIKTFYEERNNQEEVIGILPMYSGKLGGGYLVGLKPGMSRETLIKTCDKMKEGYPKIEIDYFSATDGTDTSAIRIEQDIQSEYFSSFIGKGQVRFLDNMGSSILGDYRTFLSEKRDGILFDTIARKIYYKNERLTSVDVPSQTTLTDIMNILIDRIGEDVEHTAFPHSSYMKNKNEMLGKIVIPLIRFLEKHTGLVLPLVCKGELGSFYLKLENTTIPIGVIRKI